MARLSAPQFSSSRGMTLAEEPCAGKRILNPDGDWKRRLSQRGTCEQYIKEGEVVIK
jgi:hypothetical protein